jgi:hypothetical protein
MPEGIRRLIEPFLALSPSKQMLLAMVAFISAIAFAVLIFVANRTDYRPLFTNLTSEDAGEIVKKLKDAKTPYQITADGKGLWVNTFMDGLGRQAQDIDESLIPDAQAQFLVKDADALRHARDDGLQVGQLAADIDGWRRECVR